MTLQRRYPAWVWGAGALLILLAGALAWPRSSGRELELPLARLQDTLAAAFPIDGRENLLIHWRLTHPRLDPGTGSGELALSMDVRLDTRLDGRHFDAKGRIVARVGLRYEPMDGALHLQDPRVVEWRMPQLPSAQTARMADSVRALLVRTLAEVPVHRLAGKHAHAPLHDWRTRGDIVVLRWES